LKYKRIHIKHLPFTLHIFIGGNGKEVSARLNRIKNKLHKHNAQDFELSSSSSAYAYDLEYSLPGHYAIVFKHTDLNTIAHEVFHIVMWHNKYIGQRFNNGNEESFAYLFGYLISEIYDFQKTNN
jgi:hypothetical protein